MSIWDGLDRRDFESQVIELQKIAPSQRLVLTATLEQNVSDVASMRTVDTLPIKVERQVVDDIAFLAASEASEGGVTAATLQSCGNRNETTINLAANEGVSDQIIDSITRVLKLLELCAQSVVSREDCSRQVLDLILDLHRLRILEKLGLYTRKGAPRKRICISDRLSDLLSEPRKSGSSVTRASLLVEIGVLKEAIDDLHGDTSQDIALFRHIVQAAANIAKPAESLTTRLIKAGFSEAQAERREIREIKGLANYLHSCNRLSNIVRVYRANFESLTLNAIIADRVEIWPARSGIKHYVHAEIQLLIHHETCLQDRRPRYIGVSKQACFLCYRFLRAYGEYVLPETHGEVLPQWTVPDRDGLTNGSRKRVRRALSQTASDVHTALAASKVHTQRSAPGIQSRNHSIIFSLASASASTLRPVRSITTIHSAEKHGSSSDHGKVPGSSSHASTISQSLLEDSQVEIHTDRTDGPSIFEFEWLKLHVYSKSNLRANLVHEIIGQSSTTACNGASRAAKDLATDQVIRIEDCRLDAGLTMIGAKANELDVVFMRNDGSQLRIGFTAQL